MRTDKFIAARIALGWSRHGIAAQLGCSEDMLRQMEGGLRHIPPSVERWLIDLADYHAAHPPPEDWRPEWMWQEWPGYIR
jgi:hypothetical protein